MSHQFTCEASGCEFMVQSENENEIIDLVQQHAQDQHGMAMEKADIRSGIQTV